MEVPGSGQASTRLRALAVAADARRADVAGLWGASCEVSMVASVDEALSLAREELPDILILALPLARGEPAAAVQRCRADTVAAEVPVMVLSPQRDEALVVQCLGLGAADVVYDGLGTAELVARLERCVRSARRERALAELAQLDALTGLANFGALRTRLELEFKRANRYAYPISAVMIDLDYLKRINDQHGHDVGNRAIVALASHLARSLRETDFAARFGGDEFVVLLPYQTPSEAAVLLERLRSGLATVRVSTPDGDGLGLTLSAGIAGHAAFHPKRDAGDLLSCADVALYDAKRSGRDRVVVFEASRLPEGQESSAHVDA